MSAAPALAPSITLPVAPGAPAGPRPTPVDPATRVRRATRPRVRYALVAVTGIFGILLAQLLLSMVVSEGAYEIQALQGANKELARDVQELAETQQRLSSTQHLVANAAALGMVSDPNRVFLRLSDGAVLGTPVPASADHAAVTNSDLVSNTLVEDLPVAAAVAAEAEQNAKASEERTAGSADSGDRAAPGAPDAGSGAGSLASNGEGLPSPVTH